MGYVVDAARMAMVIFFFSAGSAAATTADYSLGIGETVRGRDGEHLEHRLPWPEVNEAQVHLARLYAGRGRRGRPRDGAGAPRLLPRAPC